MQNIFFSGGLAFLITFFSIPAIIEIAKTKKLFDVPDGRKVHKAAIPRLGGLGIFAGFSIAVLMGVPPSMSGVLQYIMAAVVIIFFIGVKDDILIISATKKFISQLIAAGIIIKFGALEITNMYGFMGIHELSPTVGVLLTLFLIVVVTNSFNLIDGVDGLAGSLGLMSAAIFGFYFIQTGQDMYAVMAFSLTGSLIAFLIFNFNPAKIFMGDTGSLLIGLLNSIFVIKFITTATSGQYGTPLESAPAIGFAILIVPLFDTLRVFAVRIFNRKSPFCPDKNHIHHLLLDIGLKHRAVTFSCVGANLAFIAFAYYFRFLGNTYLILLLSGIAFLVVAIIYYSRPKKKVFTFSTNIKKVNKTAQKSKLLTINGEPLEQPSSI